MITYTFRITPDEHYTIEQIVEIWSSKVKAISKIIIAQENEPHVHLHVYLETTHTSYSVMKYKRQHFPLWNKKANEVWYSHACDTCKKHEDCIGMGACYTCKDGCIIYYSGYTQEEIDHFVYTGQHLKPKKKTKETVVSLILKTLGWVDKGNTEITSPKWGDTLIRGDNVPTGKEVVGAMIAFYAKTDRHLPQRHYAERTLHNVRMVVDPWYRRENYNWLEQHYNNLGSLQPSRVAEGRF